MANCCGAPRCSCRVVAGTGATVTGNGSAANPYTISTDPAATALVVQDTPTVDLGLTGTGAAGDPYTVTADVQLDPTPPQGGDNLLQAGPEGLFVECADLRGCFSAGDGAGYDPTTGEITARVSGDAGNTTVIGADGGLYTPASSTTVQATDTPSVDVTVSGTGTTGDPYDVSAAVRLDPTPPGGGSNLLAEGPDGLYVECADVRTCFSAGDGAGYDEATGVITARLSADAGNGMAFGADGGLYAPTGGGGAPSVVTAGDTETANNTVTGTGASGDPYVVTTDVVVDPAPPAGGTNLLSAGPDGLYVECADVRTCFSAGDGAGYDPTTGEITARVSGDAGNTTVIGADGGLYTPASSTALEAADTPTVDVTVTGTGTAGTPFQVAAAVILDPVPPGGGSNLLAEGPDGLYVECADVRTCFSAGDGAGYDEATGVITARLSADAGNGMAFGVDGGLYAPTGGGGTPSVVTAGDTTTADNTVTGTGAAGDPYVVTTDVIVAPEDNGVEAGPDGLLVAPSADADNRLAFGADGRLYVPPVPPPEVGCGLQGEGTAASPLAAFPIAGEQPWADDWDCDAATFSTVKCDPTTGAIWTPPEHTSAAISQQQNHPLGTPAIGVTTGFIIIDNTAFAQGQYTADTLSTCRGFSFSARFTGRVEVSWTANATFDLGYGIQIDGGALAVRQTHSVLAAGPAGRERWSFGISQATVLPRTPATRYACTPRSVSPRAPSPSSSGSPIPT
ncbi:hypothetical protein ACQPXT_13280 [Streptomyces sp. CA-100214]